MKIIKLLLIAVLASASQFVSSQGEAMLEVIYLKNGSIVKGSIIEQIPNQSLKIKTTDGNVFEYKIEDVEKITKEATPRSTTPTSRTRQYQENTSRNSNLRQGQQQNRTTSSYRERQIQNQKDTEASDMNIARYSGFVQFCGMGYQHDGDALYYDLNASFGCRFAEQFYIGIGFGVTPTYYTAWEEFDCIFPLFISPRVNFTRSRVSPFLQTDLGYKIHTNDFENAFFMHPTIGLDFNLGASKRKAIFLSFSIIEYGSNYRYNDSDFYIKAGLNLGLRW